MLGVLVTRWRRDVVGASPFHDLVFSVLINSFLFVESLKGTYQRLFVLFFALMKEHIVSD